MKKWKILEKSAIYKNQWFEIFEHKVQVSEDLALEGVIVLQFTDWVNIIALDNDQNLLLERNYRHGKGEVCIETPSGTIESSDVSPEAAARRELLEETGFRAEQMILLGRSDANAQLQNNSIHHYLALGCQKIQGPQGEIEGPIESFQVPFKDALKMVERGEISNGYIVEGLLRAERHLK